MFSPKSMSNLGRLTVCCLLQSGGGWVHTPGLHLGHQQPHPPLRSYHGPHGPVCLEKRICSQYRRHSKGLCAYLPMLSAALYCSNAPITLSFPWYKGGGGQGGWGYCLNLNFWIDFNVPYLCSTPHSSSLALHLFVYAIFRINSSLIVRFSLLLNCMYCM